MLLEMNRLLTEEEVKRLYKMPDDIYLEVMRTVPVMIRVQGVPLYRERDVDRAVDSYPAEGMERCRQEPRCGSTSSAAPTARGKPGRKATTTEVANFANERRPARTWKEIAVEWHSRFPTARAYTADQVRDAWRRRFGDKSNKKQG